MWISDSSFIPRAQHARTRYCYTYFVTISKYVPRSGDGAAARSEVTGVASEVAATLGQKYTAIIAVSALYARYSAMRRTKETVYHDIACETEIWDFHGPVPPPG